MNGKDKGMEGRYCKSIILIDLFYVIKGLLPINKLYLSLALFQLNCEYSTNLGAKGVDTIAHFARIRVKTLTNIINITTLESSEKRKHFQCRVRQYYRPATSADNKVLSLKDPKSLSHAYHLLAELLGSIEGSRPSS